MSVDPMNVALPESLKDYVLQQVAAGTYSSVSEYVRELIRADQKRKARAQLEQTLLDSLAEEEGQEATPEF